MTGGGSNESSQTQDTRVPPEFQASFEQLFNSSFAAARQAGGQESAFAPSRGQFFGSQPFSPISTGFGGGGGGGGFRGPTDGRGNPIGLGGFSGGGGGGFGGGGFGGFGGFGGRTPGTGAGFQQPRAPQTGPGIGGGATFRSGQGTPQPQGFGGFGQQQQQSQQQAAQGAPSAPSGAPSTQAPASFTQFNTPPPTDFIPKSRGTPFVRSNAGDERSRVPLAFGEPIVGQQFAGPFIAPANQLELESLASREQVGRDLAGAGNITSQLGQSTAAGAFLSPDSNPFLRQTIEAANRPTIENFQRNILPSFNSRAIQGGAFKGSSAREFVQAQLASDLSNTIGDTSAQLANQNFARERQIQQNAPFLIDAGARLNQLSPEILGQVGQGIRGLEQLNIQDQLLRLQEQNEAPFRPLFNLASILQGSDIGSSVKEKSSGSSGGGAGQAIGGAIAGAGLLGNILIPNT